MTKYYYLQVNFWTRNPIPLFRLLDNPNANKLLITSCFNRTKLNFRMFKNKKYIFYSGEKFLYEPNCSVIISFLPNNEDYNNLSTEDKNLTVYSINLNKSIYKYFMNHQKIKLKDIDYNNKQIIQLRNQELSYIEKFFMKNKINKLSLSDIEKINMYQNLEHVRLQTYNNLVNKSSEEIKKIKPKFCCFIVSNPHCKVRNKIFELMKIINKPNKIDSMGKYLKNVDFIIPDRETNYVEYIKLISQYRFIITGENISLPWYNTEKIFNAFLAGTIPIYWGDPLIHQLYNTNNFIHILPLEDQNQQINNIIEACNIVKHIESNLETEYIKYFQNPLMINGAEYQDNKLIENVKQIYDLFYN